MTFLQKPRKIEGVGKVATKVSLRKTTKIEVVGKVATKVSLRKTTKIEVVGKPKSGKNKMNKHKLSHAVRQAMFEKTNYSTIDSLDTSKVGAEVLRRLTGKKYKVIPGKLRINKWYPCDHTVIINETDKEFIDLCADEYAEVMREDFTYIWLPFKDMPKWLEFAVDECRYDIEQQIGNDPDEALVKRALEIYQEISGNVA